MIRKLATKVLLFLSSFGFAALILLFLLLITLLGTLDQVNNGLFAAQQKYFSSPVFVYRLFGVVPVLLPGAYLLMVLLFVNLVLGGIVRMRRSWSRLGLFIAHAGIGLLLLAGFVTQQRSVEGHLTLYEHESSDEFVSYHEWEIGIYKPTESGEVTEYVIPGEEFIDMGLVETRTFESPALPFDLRLTGFLENSRPVPAMSTRPTAKVAENFFLEELPWDKEAGRNVAGLYATLIERGAGHERESILWGSQLEPWIVEIGGEAWALDLRRKRRKMPFTIVLEDFERELYPRTQMAKVFLSEITKVEDGREERRKISMNEPLRHRGYTLFQASWGPSNAGPDTPLFSSFAVVRNPADHWPLYSCIIIGIGLFLYFMQKLGRYLASEARRRS